MNHIPSNHLDEWYLRVLISTFFFKTFAIFPLFLSTHMVNINMEIRMNRLADIRYHFSFTTIVVSAKHDG